MNARLPVQFVLGEGNIRLALQRIVLGKLARLLDAGTGSTELDDDFGEPDSASCLACHNRKFFDRTPHST